jgi:hypothetical protein
MGVLNDVLQWKKYKEEREAQTANAIPQAVASFIQGRQQQIDNQNSMLKTQIDAAKAGMRIENGQLVQDDSLLNRMGNSLYVLDAQGNIVNQMQMPKGAKTFRQGLTTEDIAERAKVKADASLDLAQRKSSLPTAEMKNLRQQSINALASVESLEQLAQKIPGGYQGMIDLAKGTVSRGKTSPELRSYLKEVKAAAAQIYRAKTGDTRLSDEDAASRAYPLLWNPTEDESVKELSFKRLKEDINTKIALYEDAFLTGGQQETKQQSIPMPSRSKAPKGATGWDSEKGEWVF